MFISKTNENHFQFAQYGCYEQDLIKVYKLEPAPFMVYLMLKDRLSLSIKNEDAYHDSKGYFVKFSQTTLGKAVNMTPKTVAKWMNHLKDKGLIDFDQDKTGKSYKIRIVAYEYKYKRQVKTYDEECFDLSKAIKDLTAQKQALLDEKIALMDEINKLKEQVELQKRCLEKAEKITGDINNTNDNITDVYVSTCVKNTGETPVIFTDELSNAITTNLKTSINQSILKGLENIIRDTIRQELNSKHDGLIDISTPISNASTSPTPAATRPMQENHELIAKYYRDLMGYHDLIAVSNETKRKLIDTFFENIMDMHFSKNGISVKGNDIDMERVRAVLARMSHYQMDDVIEEYSKLTIKINDHNSYIKSMIYSSILSFDAKTLNNVQHDEYQYAKSLAEHPQSKQTERNMSQWPLFEKCDY